MTYSLAQQDKNLHRTFDRLAEIFLGNEQAVAFMRDIHYISHVWDDLVDRDREVTPDRVSIAFEKSLFGINMNPFFRDNSALLLPVMINSALLWHAANDLEADGGAHAMQVAHVIRCAPGDIALMCASAIGGMEHAKKHAAELRMLMQQDSLEDYLSDHSRTAP